MFQCSDTQLEAGRFAVATFQGPSRFGVGRILCTCAQLEGRIGPESSLFCLRDRVEIEAATMKENRRLQMLPIAETTGVFLIVWILELSPSLRALVIR
jgi:hypothetical protein